MIWEVICQTYNYFPQVVSEKFQNYRSLLLYRKKTKPDRAKTCFMFVLNQLGLPLSILYVDEKFGEDKLRHVSWDIMTIYNHLFFIDIQILNFPKNSSGGGRERSPPCLFVSLLYKEWKQVSMSIRMQLISLINLVCFKDSNCLRIYKLWANTCVRARFHMGLPLLRGKGYLTVILLIANEVRSTELAK